MIKDLGGIVALTPRDRIYSTIAQNPGLHFREVQRRTGIATGAMQYHVDYLKKKNLVREEKEGKFSRFYALQADIADTKLMNLLRQDSVRKIIVFLMDRRRATLPTISKSVGLGLSTTSFHMQKLLLAQIVLQKPMKGKLYFSLRDKESILGLLVEYRHSFLDVLVDNFIDTWEKELKI
ncbi:MAG: winged helix-turn-helix transcriptional regulator [Candidatus Diapherotrites archaeon]|nr:winged helix-turn-helix transcriptional regulator [Candidatus Diapherotrites archaeon]